MTWVEGRLTAGEGWADAWTKLLAAMNHRRDWLRSRAGGIVLVVPGEYRSLVRQVASDLWSVRGPTLTVGTSWRHPTEGRVPLEWREPVARPLARPGSPLTLDGEELDDDAARRAASLLAGPGLDVPAAEALAGDAERAGRNQLAAVVLNALSQAVRLRDPARAHAAAVRAVALPGVDDATRLRSLEVLVEDALAVGPLDEAGDAAHELLAIARRLADQVGTPEAQRDLSVSLDNAGRVAQARGRWDEAADAYAESLAIRRRLADQVGTPEARRDLAVALLSFARLPDRRDREALLAEARQAAAASGDEDLLAALPGAGVRPG